MTDRVTGGPRRAGSAERVRRVLAEHGIADRVVGFDSSTKTAQMAADAVGSRLGQIVKSLVLVGSEGRAAAVLVAGDRRGDMEAAALELGWPSARMADADEVRAATGYSIGGVSPFDLPEGLPVLIDESLLRFDEVWTAAGTPSSVVPLSIGDLRAFSRGRVARVSHE